jgi:cell division protein FtsB
MQFAIADLKGELSETQKLNQTLTAENRKLVRENADLRDELVTQKRRLMEAEQTIRDIKDENDKLRDVEDIACIEAVRRARMEMLIIRNGAKRGADRQREEYEAEIEKLSDDCRRQIDAVRKESENSKVRNRIAEGILLLLVVILASILCI